MRYIDSASRNTSDVLGEWLASFHPLAVGALRWQTGYFSADGLAPLVPVINELKSQDRLTNCVIGSNGGETGEPDIETLVHLVGTPRVNARIGVVNFSAGLAASSTWSNIAPIANVSNVSLCEFCPFTRAASSRSGPDAASASSSLRRVSSNPVLRLSR